MSPIGTTNEEKIFQAVIADEQLVNYYGYDPTDFSSINDALNSDIAIIRAIALIIYKAEQERPEREIYNEVSNFLKSNI